MSSYLEKCKAAEKQLADAESAYKSAVRKAEKGVKDAQQKHKDALKKLKKQEIQEDIEYSSTIAQFGKACLYSDKLCVGKRELLLDESITVEVLAGAQIHDNGVVSVIVRSQEGQLTLVTRPENEASARIFVDAIINASKRAKEKKALYEDTCKTRESRKKAAEEDTQGIKDAEDELARVEADTSAIAQAEEQLETIKNSATLAELHEITAYEEKQKKNQGRAANVVIVGGLLFIIAAIILIVRMSLH